ncbi:SDR family oxidoreductase [Sulfitobacter sp. NFXS29]|uniref:SDR family NAD(P)-dependent oxidoreductase n=1 Tax=Sulfitobacter sp. NFXS29 TaxID=2818438 RepID=UPI0032DE518C|tara:strand:- start:2593 stop:3354 length:762 start_codon:yes stop_codon:yes gene_type:complete
MTGFSEILDTFKPDLLAGKSAIVVGATSGIGLDIARGLAALGATVIGTGSSAEKIAKLEEEDIAFQRLDVRDAEAIRSFCAAQERVDILVNGAGIARGGAEWDEEIFLDTMDVNLNAQMRFSFALHDKLAEAKGAVVNIASMLSFMADPEVPAYCASKTGVLGLTRACAHKWGREGIRVNAIAPGYHQTDMTKPIWSRPEGEQAISKRTAMGRWGTTQDLVGATIFLVSPAAAYITGICLEVDGGFATGNPLD